MYNKNIEKTVIYLLNDQLKKHNQIIFCQLYINNAYSLF